MKYDDASWHYGGEFPKNLPPEAGATHIGMFLYWLLSNGYASEDLAKDAKSEIEKLKNKKLTGAQFLMDILDEKFIDGDLNAEGNDFTIAYYEGENCDSKFIDDYFEIFGVNEKTMYGVTDSFENLQKIFPKISRRYDLWVSSGRPKYLK